MKILNNFTKNIHSTHDSNLAIRAKYLYDLYRSEPGELLTRRDYLDIGCGHGLNSKVFGEEFDNIYCSDIRTDSLLKCKENIGQRENVFHIASDAQHLSFKDEHFDLVTAISLIEHVPDQEQMLREVLRVLKREGKFVMQFPNRHFFVELHSGIPFYCLIPGFAGPWVADKLGFRGMYDINIPSPTKVKSMITNIDPSVSVKIIKVIYPVDVVPLNFHSIYSVFKRIGALKLVPFGWLLVCKKN